VNLRSCRTPQLQPIAATRRKDIPVSTKTFTEEEITERVRVLATKPVDRPELDSFINSLEYGSPFHYVLTAYRAKLDGHSVDEVLAYDIAMRISESVIEAAEQKLANGQERTQHESLSVRYLGRAMFVFSGDQDAEHRA
jgi:hypothetical protein